MQQAKKKEIKKKKKEEKKEKKKQLHIIQNHMDNKSYLKSQANKSIPCQW